MGKRGPKGRHCQKIRNETQEAQAKRNTGRNRKKHHQSLKKKTKKKYPTSKEKFKKTKAFSKLDGPRLRE